jgi:hypothetical protein
METNKSNAIIGVWASVVAIILVILLTGGMEFFGILILLGIAAVMTFGIMNYGGNGTITSELDQLKETVKELDDKIDELKKLLEE